MGKYVIKESQLRSIIENIIFEELSGRLDEGFWHTAGKVAKTAGLGLIAPTYLAQRAIVKTGEVINGNGRIFNNRSSSSGFGGDKTNNNKTAKSKKIYGFKNRTGNVRVDYGDPQTRGGLGKRLEKKRDVIETNFLGTGRDVNFGKHYWERNQNSNSSTWKRMIERAKEDIAECPDVNKVDKYVKQYERGFGRWLKERDGAYENFIKQIR